MVQGIRLLLEDEIKPSQEMCAVTGRDRRRHERLPEQVELEALQNDLGTHQDKTEELESMLNLYRWR